MGRVRSRWVLGVSMVAAAAALLVGLLVGASGSADQVPARAGDVQRLPRFASATAGLGDELVSKRTEHSRTFRRADGGFRAVVSAAPMNYRDANGGWKAIDTDLTSDGRGGLRTTAAATDVSLPGSLDEPVKVSDGSRWVSFALKDAAVAGSGPAVDGATATYDEALAGVDASYVAQARGLKETLTLSDAQAPSRYSFALDAGAGLTPRLRDDGSLVFADAGGVVRFTLPAPTVQADGDAAASTDHVAYELSADHGTLTIAVDPQWLQGARFPVRVDPTVWSGDEVSCTLADGTLADQSDCGGSTLQVGHDVDHEYRTAVRFPDLTGVVPRDASITWTTVRLYFDSQTDPDAAPTVTATGLSRPPAAGATWNRSDATTTWSTPGGDVLSDPQPEPGILWPSYAGWWVGWDISATVQRWVRDPASNHGVLLKMVDPVSDDVVSFEGDDSDNGPQLAVDYQMHPGLEADQTFVSVPVDNSGAQVKANVATGNLAADGTDIHLPGAGGLDLDVRRTYNSLNPGDQTGLFGSAWTMSINNAAFLAQARYNGAAIILANGHGIYRFDRDYAHDTATANAYISPPNLNATMVGDPSTGGATLTFDDGTVWTYEDHGNGPALSSVNDGNGHHIDITPRVDDPNKIDTITDANGDDLQFTYGTDGQLDRITAADSRHWDYTTDTTNGALILTSATDADDHTTTYTYADDLPDTFDNLRKITNPDGHDVDLLYGGPDGTQVTQITRQIDSDPDHDQVWQLDYAPDANTGDQCPAAVDGHEIIGRTVVTTPDNEPVTYCYDARAVVVQTLPIQAAAPSSTAPPTITGTAREGETLEATTGTWDGDEPITYTYQWQRCDASGANCTDIDDATHEHHALSAEDLAATLRVVVTGTNAVGEASGTSSPTDVVSAGLPRNDVPPSVEGEAHVGTTLTATDGDWSFSDPLTFSRQWQRCDSAGALCRDIPSATDDSYTLTADDLRATVRVAVTATGAGGMTTAKSERSDLVGPPAPANTALPSLSGDTVDGGTLTADDGTWSALGTPDHTRQWQRCDAVGRDCADVRGETGTTYTLTPDDIGATIRVVVTVDDGDASADATSAPTAVIVAAAPVGMTAPAISGTAIDGRRLTVGHAAWSGTTPFRYTFQWRRCDAAGANCADVEGAIDEAYVLRAADVGGTLRAVVTASNDAGSATAITAASATVLATAPVNAAVPTLSGTALEGETLVADDGRWTGTTPAYAHRWRRCDSAGASCADISGATGASYMPTGADVGGTLRVVVTASNTVGSATATSAPSTVVLPDPTFTAAISGVAALPASLEADDTIGRLRAVPGDVAGPDPVAFAYQWQRCDGAGASCVDITDESWRTYALRSADLGHSVRVVVTATDGDDVMTTAVSSPSAVVAVRFLTPYEQILPAVAGRPAVGATVTASPGDWPMAATLTYAWQRCDADGVGCSPIAGATMAAYVIQPGDVGARLAVAVTGTDATGSTTLLSRPSEVVSLDSMTNTALPTLTTGAGARGTVISSTTGSWSSAASGDISYTYAWQRCDVEGVGCARLLGATGHAYPLSAEDVGHTIRAVVTATDTGGRAVARSEVSAVVESAAPSASTGPTIAGTAREGTVLAAVNGTWTGVGTSDLRYQWQRCDVAGGACEDVDGADGADYTPQAADVGHRLRVAETATNADGDDTVTSAVSSAVTAMDAPGPGPANTVAPTIAGAATVGATLTADPGLWTGAGPIAYTYRWQTCDPDGGCFDIPDATGTAFTPAASQVGSLIQVLVTATDADGSTTVAAETTRSVAATTGPALDAAPSITGTPEEGDELTVSHGEWTSMGDLDFTVQWQTCPDGRASCVSLDDATGFTYVPSAEDVDAGLRAAVTATDGDGHRVTVLSTITADVTPVSPFARSTPEISGAPVTGETLHATAPTWDGDAPIASTFQWQRCDQDGHCDDIEGATNAAHVVVGEDVGASIAVEVTGTNDRGEDVASSNPTAVVTDADGPSAQTLPSVSGVAAEGELLLADAGTWSTTGTTTFDYQWLACTADGETCDPIDGETAGSLLLGPEQTYGTVRVAVTANDEHGAATVRSPATAVVAEAAPVDDTPIVNTQRPSIDGTSQLGMALTADPGTWTGPADLAYQYRWRVCDVDVDGDCVVIDGATDPTFVPTAAEVGRRIDVFVTAVSASGAVTVASDATAAVLAEPPVRMSSPYLVYGDRVLGATMSVDPGTWSDPEAQISETWQRCDSSGGACTTIPGAEGEDHLLTTGDVGRTLRAVVTATNDLGSDTYTTEASEVVRGALVNGTPPSLTGDAVAGSPLTLDYGEWSDAVVTLRARWQRCDASGDNCTDLDVVAWETQYTPTKADVGHTIKATVTGGNDGGELTVATDPSDVVTAAAMPANTTPPTISGTPQPGGTLTLDDGTWAGAPGTTERDWLHCDVYGTHCHEIDGAHDSTYRPSRSDVPGTIRAQVTVANAAGSMSARTAATSGVMEPPAISNVIAPQINMAWGTSAGNTAELTAAGQWAGAPQTIAWQWQRCVPATTPLQCTDIPDATNDYYYTYSEDVGFLLRIKETASDPTAPSVVAYSSTTIAPVSIDVYDNGMSLSGARAAGQTITAHTSAWTSVPMPQSIHYTFTRDSGGSTTVLQSGPNAGYELTDLDVGQQIVVTADITIQTPGVGTPVAERQETTSFSPVAERLIGDTAPAVSGDPTSGALLTASTGTWHGGGGSLAYAYAWQRCDAAGDACVDVDSATDATYRSTRDDIGHALRVRVAARPDVAEATAVTAVSDPTDPIAAGTAPENTAAPTVSGAPAERSALSAAPGSWTSAAPITYAYQWQSCDPDDDPEVGCADIDGATSQTYTATADELDRGLRVVVTATNATGATTATSETTDAVSAGTPPAARSMPSLTLLGTPDPGSTLVTDGGDWDGAGEDDLTYVWQRCDWIGANCATIAGASAQSYDLTTADVDHQLKVTVTATNDGGTTQAASTLSETITNGPAGLMRAAGDPIRTSAADRIVYFDNRPDPVWDDEEDQSLRLVDRDGANATTVATCGQLTGANDCILGHPRISPNLKMIVVENHPSHPTFARGREGWDGIYLINYDGTRPRYLAEGSDPVWSSDGTDILYSKRNANGPDTAMIIRADGRRTSKPKTLVTFDGTFENTPERADDGSVTFAGRTGSDDGSDLYYMASSDGKDGGAESPRRITLPSRFGAVREPRFTADADAITFLAVMRDDLDAGRYDATSGWKVDVDGTGLTRMTPEDNGVYSPGTAGTDTYTTAVGSLRCWGLNSDGSCEGWSVVGGTIAVGKSDGSGLASLGVGSLENPAHAPSPAPVARVSVSRNRCEWTFLATPNDKISQDAVAFRAENRAVGFDLNMAACGPNIVLQTSGDVTITQVSNRHVLMRTSRFRYYRNPIPELNAPVASLRFPCTPAMDDLQDYRVDLKPTGEPGLAIRPVDEDATPIDPGAPSSKIVHLRCPSRSERQRSEFHAWKALGHYNPKSKNLIGSKPSRILGWNISTLRPSKIRGAWDAHHVIPASDPSGLLRVVQAGAFRCHLYPNSADNGTWLRSYRFKSDSTNYLRLSPPDQKRTWHPVTYIPQLKGDYFERLAGSLVGHGIERRKGTCTSRTQLRNALTRVASALVAGRYLPSSAEEEY